MPNIYLIQLVGVITTGLGMIALTASSYMYGKPLSHEEKQRMGKTGSNISRLPINLETILSALLFLGGMGILTWSKFSLCGFLSYWMPYLPDAIRFLLACTT